VGSKPPCGSAVCLSCRPRRNIDLIGPELPVEIVATLRRCFPEAAVHCFAQQNPRTNVVDADVADL
jgi:hypothetical protein